MMLKLCCIIACQLYLVLADAPGIRVQFTQKALNAGLELGMKYLQFEISSQQLPDTKGSTTIESEPVEYEITQIKLENFQCSRSSATFVPSIGVKVSLQDAIATLSNNWKLNSWLIKDSGTSTVNVTGLSVTLILGVQRKESGIPLVFQTSCESDIKEVKIQMFGGVSYFYDTFKDEMEKLVRNTIQEQLCSTIRMKVQKLDEYLTQSLSNISINRFSGLNATLVNDPIFTTKEAEVNIKGMFYSLVNMTEFNLPPAPITFVSQSESMLIMGVSEASLNSASQAFYAAGGFTNSLSKYIGYQILTTSNLTAVLPEQISKQFKNPATVQVIISATRAPTISLKPDNLTVEFAGVVTTFASQVRAKRVTLFSANVVISISANMSMSNSNLPLCLNLTGSIKSINRFQLQIEKNSSATKSVQNENTEEKLKDFTKTILIPLMDTKLKTGIVLPAFNLKNPALRINPTFMQLAADIQLESEGPSRNITNSATKNSQ